MKFDRRVDNQSSVKNDNQGMTDRVKLSNTSSTLRTTYIRFFAVYISYKTFGEPHIWHQQTAWCIWASKYRMQKVFVQISTMRIFLIPIRFITLLQSRVKTCLLFDLPMEKLVLALHKNSCKNICVPSIQYAAYPLHYFGADISFPRAGGCEGS